MYFDVTGAETILYLIIVEIINDIHDHFVALVSLLAYAGKNITRS